MKLRKLKKSLSTIFLSKIYFKSTFFVIQKERKALNFFYSYTFLKVLTKFFFKKSFFNTFKYPLYIRFFKNFEEMQKNSFNNLDFILLNFKELFLKTNCSILKNSIFCINLIKHLEFFCKKDFLVLNYIQIINKDF